MPAIRVGQVYEIADPPGRFYYAAIGRGEDVVFFDETSDQSAAGPDIVVKAKPFLRLAVSHPTIKRAGWRLLGEIPPVGVLGEFAKYVQGNVTGSEVRIYNNADTSVRTVPRAEAEGMEVLAVWDAVSHIVPILRQHFFGEPSSFAKEIRSTAFRHMGRDARDIG